MNGGDATGMDSKKISVNQSYKRQDAVESHDRQGPEDIYKRNVNVPMVLWKFLTRFLHLEAI